MSHISTGTGSLLVSYCHQRLHSVVLFYVRLNKRMNSTLLLLDIHPKIINRNLNKRSHTSAMMLPHNQHGHARTRAHTHVYAHAHERNLLQTAENENGITPLTILCRGNTI